jgi:hypothetical protein
MRMNVAVLVTCSSQVIQMANLRLDVEKYN